MEHRGTETRSFIFREDNVHREKDRLCELCPLLLILCASVSLCSIKETAGLRKLPHSVGNELQACESFSTAWATNCRPTKASPRRGQQIAGLRKLPHGVGNELQACESFPTPWATNCRSAKASPHRGQRIASLRKLPHGVGSKSQACENINTQRKTLCLCVLFPHQYLNTSTPAVGISGVPTNTLLPSGSGKR